MPPNRNLIDDKNITWLEDPIKYTYLRCSNYETNNSKGRIDKRKFWKLVGYKFISKGYQKGSFIYEIYWLKDYDKDCINEHKEYSSEELVPSEAVYVRNADIKNIIRQL
jgi:hypothetical protein